ncbi:MAG: hypothetical protein COT24_03995 [Candidatus Kerfeldbacteria bacterium CG08_land_8_20_14_0_20_40_16]|uniref:Transcobalamin-like C-terminal domain-containing protein n=1 Tax=Candidatus Kerfeldbacteria bacterium CG08_land_8_20_14_0_20_40_16 TaxID=2014244 RepID=A0A2H0YVB1_9BACT|nr:MAG: hypothetical protein COT24_03995 [Candidatus Kerfeldbacteria bacterium CG08_land_8_20_14_0_20_40_16]
MSKKRIYFLAVILITLSLVGAGCLTKETSTETGQVKGEATETAQLQVDLVINTGNSNLTYTISVIQDSTVLALLQSASEKYGLALEVQDSTYGPFVQALAGKNGGEDGKYWIYYVNGEAATVGVGEQIAKDGDKIEFKFE